MGRTQGETPPLLRTYFAADTFLSKPNTLESTVLFPIPTRKLSPGKALVGGCIEGPATYGKKAKSAMAKAPSFTLCLSPGDSRGISVNTHLLTSFALSGSVETLQG